MVHFNRAVLLLAVCLWAGIACGLTGSTQTVLPGVDSTGNLNQQDAGNGDQDISGTGLTKFSVDPSTGVFKVRSRGTVTNNSGAKFKSAGNDAVAEVDNQAAIGAATVGFGGVVINLDKGRVKVRRGKGQQNSARIKLAGRGGFQRID